MIARRAFVLVGAAFAVVRSNAAADSIRMIVGLDPTRSVGPDDQDRLVNRITGALIRSGRYDIVDRSRLEAIKREQGLSNSPYADPKTAAALGKILGAQRMLALSSLSLENEDEPGPLVMRYKVEASASFQMLEVATARVLVAGTADGTGGKETTPGVGVNRAQLIRDALSDCADDVVNQVLSAK